MCMIVINLMYITIKKLMGGLYCFISLLISLLICFLTEKAFVAFCLLPHLLDKKTKSVPNPESSLSQVQLFCNSDQ